MNSDVIRVLEDDPDAYGQLQQVTQLARNYGYRVEFVSHENPVEDGLRRLHGDTTRRIVGVVTDSFEQPREAEDAEPFRHIVALRRLRPELIIVLYSGDPSSRKHALARAAGANACFVKGESLTQVFQFIADRAAHSASSPLDRFWQELPALLERKFGKWVVYTSAGELMEGEGELELYERCRHEGLPAGTFVVAQVVPDQPVADLPQEFLGAQAE